MGEIEVEGTPFPMDISCPICKGNKCSVCDTGPSLNDIINCTHYDLKGQKYRKRSCECVEGEIGWTNKSGKFENLGEVTIKTKQGDIITKTVIRQLNAVHTTRWENKYNLQKRFGNKARSSLRISKNVIDLLNRQTGRSGRDVRKEFAKGLPASGNTHRIRRQIFLLFHTDAEHLLKLLQSYSSNSEYREKIDSIRGKEKVNVVTYIPVFERATDDLIDKIKTKADRLTIAENKLDFSKHPLLKDKSKWRWNLCRLVELRFIHKKFQLKFPEDPGAEPIDDIYTTPELEESFEKNRIKNEQNDKKMIELPFIDKISGNWKTKMVEEGINTKKSLDEYGEIEEDTEG